jgi:hypothetical protein
MKRARLLELLGGDSGIVSHMMAANLVTSARVMLDRGQSNCAMDIITVGLVANHKLNWEAHGITNAGIFQALNEGY